MKVKLKTLRMKNFCGYRDAEFSFKRSGRINDISMFFGPNGVGKCEPGSYFINIKNKGIVRLADVFEGFDLKPQTWYKKEFEIESNGRWMPVKNIFYNGKAKTKKIRTFSGYEIEGSKDKHSVLAIKNGEIKYVKLSEMKEGDFICIKKGGLFPDNSNILEEEAYISGYMVSEGSCMEKDMVFHNTDEEIISDFSDKYFKLFNSKPTISINKNRVYFKRKDVKKSYAAGYCSPGKSGDKQVPSLILSSTEEIYCCFLRSYFEGDGGVEKKLKKISCASKSEELIKQLQIMLLRLNIVSNISQKKSKLSYTKKYPNGYNSWRLYISGKKNINAFSDKIGFISSRKKEELNSLIKDFSKKSHNPNRDVIPTDLFRKIANSLKNKVSNLPKTGKRNAHFSRSDYKNASKGLYCLQENYLNRIKLGVSNVAFKNCVSTISLAMNNPNLFSELKKEFEWLNKNYYFDTIKSIKNGEDDLFDVCVEEDHCFWSNGFINHNSSVLNAILMVSSPKTFQGRDTSLAFRKLVFDHDYDPTFQEIKAKEGLVEKQDMELEGIFEDEEGNERRVVLCFNDKMRGVAVNELPLNPRGFNSKTNSYYAYYIDADNPAHMNRFTINDDYKDKFLDLAKVIYGYDCSLGADVDENGAILYDDMIINKTRNGEDIKVHYKTMSAGEKKIATLLRHLCNPEYINSMDIVLVDNIEMHVYFKRHANMLDKLTEHFPGKQFIATTHSATMIDHVGDVYGEESLYDLEFIHEGEGKRYSKPIGIKEEEEIEDDWIEI